MVMLFVKSRRSGGAPFCELSPSSSSSFKTWIKILFIFIWLFCGSSRASIRHRCIRKTVLQERLSSASFTVEQKQQQPSTNTKEDSAHSFQAATATEKKELPPTLLQQLSQSTICEECHVEMPPLPPNLKSNGNSQTRYVKESGLGRGGADKDELSATLFLPPWYSSTNVTIMPLSHGNLLNIAGELLQKGLYVTILRIQYDNEDNPDHQQQKEENDMERKWIWHQVMSSLPCHIIHKTKNLLSIQFETLIPETTISSKNGNPSSNNNEEKITSQNTQTQPKPCTVSAIMKNNEAALLPPKSPYHPCAIDSAPQIYKTLRIRYLQMLTRFPNETVLPDVFVMEASLVGGMLLAEKLRATCVLVAPPSILPLVAERAQSDGSKQRLGPFHPPQITPASTSNFYFFPSSLLAVIRGGSSLLSWTKHLLQDRMQSFSLTTSFIRLNKLRRSLALRTIHSPTEYFDHAAAIIVDTPPKFETFRTLSEFVHLTGPLIPECVSCSNISSASVEQQTKTALFKRGRRQNTDKNKLKQRQQPQSKLMHQEHNIDALEDDEFIQSLANEVSTNSSHPPLMILIGPMEQLNLLQSRALIRALSYARDELQTFAIGACKGQDEVDAEKDECAKFASGSKSQQIGGQGTMDDIMKVACYRRKQLIESQCLRYLQMAAFQVIMHPIGDMNTTGTSAPTQSYSQSTTRLPEAFPAFVTLMESDNHKDEFSPPPSLLIDSAIRHPETALLISQCHHEQNDWREAIVLKIPVICIPIQSSPSSQHYDSTALRVSALGTKRGWVQVAMKGTNGDNFRAFTIDMAKTVMDMMLRIQFRKLKLEMYEENAVYVPSDALYLSSELFTFVGEEGLDPIEDVQTLAEAFIEGDGLHHAAAIIRKAGKLHKHAGFWSSSWRSSFNQALQRHASIRHQQYENRHSKPRSNDPSEYDDGSSVTMAEQVETLLIRVAWFVIFVAICFVLKIWDKNIPDWFKRYMYKYCYTPKLKASLCTGAMELKCASQVTQHWYEYKCWQQEAFMFLQKSVIGEPPQDVNVEGEGGVEGNDTPATTGNGNGTTVTKNGRGNYRRVSTSHQGQSKRGGGTTNARKRRNGKRR